MFCFTVQLVLVVNYRKFFMAHHPCHASQMKRIPIKGEDLLGPNSEVLKLRLGALNLPITGSKGQLQNHLKRALLGNSAKPRGNTANSKQKRTSSRSHVNAQPGQSTRNNNSNWHNTGETETFPIRHNSAVIASQEQEQEDSALSDHTSLSSIEDMIESDLEINTESQQNTSFSSDQYSANKEIVSRSIHIVLNVFSTPASALNSLASNQPSCTPGTAPLPCVEDKILRGEYIDFALLLPDNLYQSQTPEIQLCNSPKNTHVNGVLYITSLTPRVIASMTILPKSPTLSAMYGLTMLLILFSPEGAFMAKTDLKSAFHLIPIHPDDWSLLGIYWQSQ